MVGGLIVDIVEEKDSWLIEVRCTTSRDRCKVRARKSPDFFPSFGDSLWWQKSIYWTPKNDGSNRVDVKIPKIGPSISAVSPLTKEEYDSVRMKK
jgi:hypothetical protein